MLFSVHELVRVADDYGFVRWNLVHINERYGKDIIHVYTQQTPPCILQNSNHIYPLSIQFFLCVSTSSNFPSNSNLLKFLLIVLP